MSPQFSVGEQVELTDDARDNDTYQRLGICTMSMTITAVATSVAQHPGYDPGLTGEALYDLVATDTGALVPVSLYEYELAAL
ncbi:hypothetical protein MUG78_16905 [Gordonia alkaliphila]|uniref:hypothetical protein n=1 Tax=Gordonia alkaliphila TaxID=1053547 RepID=UPI001FF68671|nr:hypothetical protein [Gordonia alkaliphila]MCK0441081.1 hypothetical protein [Gordonia alkaliphila]